MSNLIDLTNTRFGRLLVVERGDNSDNNRPHWVCRCDCGTMIVVAGDHLRRGNTQSCGCSRITHGQTVSRTKSKSYIAWDSMIQRCTNENKLEWKNYGGRGITVCKRWFKFTVFMEDMGNPPTKNHSLDRIDNDLGYNKSNCRWATQSQQMRNTRNNRLIEFSGKVQCLSAWAEEYGIGQEVLKSRIQSGWSMSKALTKPVRKYRPKKGVVDVCN